MAKFIGVSHVGLTVRDVDRSAAWYERVLCLQLLGEFPQFATPGVAARVVHLHSPAEIHVALSSTSRATTASSPNSASDSII